MSPEVGGENCAVMGVYCKSPESNSVSENILASLLSMQNRGQESTGMVVSNGKRMMGSWGMGEVKRAFGDRRTWESSNGSTITEYYDRDHLARLMNCFLGIGHNRYSTTGSSEIRNAGPNLVGEFALAHNGNIVNAKELREKLEAKGVKLRGTTDSEVITQYIINQEGYSIEEKIKKSLREFVGSYSLVMMSPTTLYAARDPMANRPLSIGKLDDNTIIIASETSAMKYIIGDLEPGECVAIDNNGLRKIDQIVPGPARCLFEPTYLMRPDSLWKNERVADLRFLAGQLLFRNYPVEYAQAVTAIPYSAALAAQGFAYEAKIPYVEILYKDRWQGRIFMDPDQNQRVSKTNKYSVMIETLKKLNIQNLVVIDDSIVRGTTTENLIRMLKKEMPDLIIDLRIVWPEILYPCFLGVDFASFTELFRHHYRETLEAAARLGARSLAQLNTKEISYVFRSPLEESCYACHDGRYPIPVPENQTKFSLG